MFDFDDLERVLSEDEARPDAWAYLLDGRDRKRSADCFLSGHGAARGFEVEAHELCIYSAACLSIHECLCVCVCASPAKSRPWGMADIATISASDHPPHHFQFALDCRGDGQIMRSHECTGTGSEFVSVSVSVCVR